MFNKYIFPPQFLTLLQPPPTFYTRTRLIYSPHLIINNNNNYKLNLFSIALKKAVLEGENTYENLLFSTSKSEYMSKFLFVVTVINRRNREFTLLQIRRREYIYPKDTILISTVSVDVCSSKLSENAFPSLLHFLIIWLLQVMR